MRASFAKNASGEILFPRPPPPAEKFASVEKHIFTLKYYAEKKNIYKKFDCDKSASKIFAIIFLRAGTSLRLIWPNP